MKAAVLAALLATAAIPASAQETAWPDPAPTDCLRSAFYHSVTFERAYKGRGDLSGLKTMGNEPRDCQRIFRWAELDGIATDEALDAQTQFANDLIAERRRTQSFATSPVGCLKVSFIEAPNPKLPTEAQCRAAGYWTTFQKPENEKQAARRSAFVAALVAELDR